MPVGLSPAAALTMESESPAISISYLMLSMYVLPAWRVISPLIGGLSRQSTPAFVAPAACVHPRWISPTRLHLLLVPFAQ